MSDLPDFTDLREQKFQQGLARVAWRAVQTMMREGSETVVFVVDNLQVEGDSLGGYEVSVRRRP